MPNPLSPPRTAAPETHGKLSAAIPILSAKHFCRQWWDGPKGEHCLEAWVLTLARDVQSGMRDALRARVGHNLVKFNDDLENSRRTLAAAWNAARKDLVTK